MDAICDATIERTIVVKAAQVAYTDGVINNTLGFFIDQDPGPILIVLPTLDLAQAWSKDRLAPMIRDTPTLTGKVCDPRARDADNTILHKLFPGGQLTAIGANSPAGLRSRPIRIVLADEVDAWPLSAGSEGDPLALASMRQLTFWNRKTLVGSTPTHPDTSVIWREYLKSDQRRYFVCCEACGHAQEMRWEQVRWDKGEDGEHKPETAHYVCDDCGAIWDDADRQAAVAAGYWEAAKPGGRVAGFHVKGFLSPFLTLEAIVRKFLEAGTDPEQLKAFWNQVIGEVWSDPTEKLEATALISRGESYTRETIPDAALILVAGVDVQVNRIEAQLLAFGVGEECWVVAYEIIHGDPTTKDPWDELDDLLLSSFHTDAGREMRVRATCVDSGGHATASVMAFCRPRFARRVYAIKGADGPRPIWPRLSSKSKKNRGAVFIVGVDTGKDQIYGRLRIARPGPGYIHFPVGAPFDQQYFDQLTSEQVQTKLKMGRPQRKWFLPKGRRNEALDCFNYALAARHSLRVRLDGPTVPVMAPPLPPPQEIEGGPMPVLSETRDPPAVAVRHSQYQQSSWLGGGSSTRRRGWFDR